MKLKENLFCLTFFCLSFAPENGKSWDATLAGYAWIQGAFSAREAKARSEEKSAVSSTPTLPQPDGVGVILSLSPVR
ncbi:MAG TPA: hypothetical protein DCR55_06475, partial [Lentisphaeria bacterium]|nr:hypothetical protein [Lentisphaeria bacterium]